MTNRKVRHASFLLFKQPDADTLILRTPYSSIVGGTQPPTGT
jgi:hypothetical protein